jgi:hypothetical protein
MKHLMVVCFCSVFFCGCALGSAALSAKGEPVIRPQFTDVPVPEGFEFLRDISDKHEWEWKKIRFGRLVYRGTLSVQETQDFYRRKMVAPDANWRETGFSSGPDVVLAYEKGSGENRESCQVRIKRERGFTIVRIWLDPIGGK